MEEVGGQVTRQAKQHPNAGKLQPGYVRYTVILSRDELDQLKGYAWYTRRKIKDIFAEMVEDYLNDHASDIPSRDTSHVGHIYEITGDWRTGTGNKPDRVRLKLGDHFGDASVELPLKYFPDGYTPQIGDEVNISVSVDDKEDK